MYWFIWNCYALLYSR